MAAETRSRQLRRRERERMATRAELSGEKSACEVARTPHHPRSKVWLF